MSTKNLYSRYHEHLSAHVAGVRVVYPHVDVEVGVLVELFPADVTRLDHRTAEKRRGGGRKNLRTKSQPE